jgi:predicted short-subunit dehydrogenase-like oxidoreductase (DUF2520 family)
MLPQPARPGLGLFGSGAVARVLGRALRERGVHVVALAARDSDRAARAAAFVGPGVAAVTTSALPGLVDAVVIAVSDEAITEVAAQLAAAGLHRGVALHTCGAAGIDALAPLSEAGVSCGVLHPLQTLPPGADSVTRLFGITFAVGGDAEAVRLAAELVARLDGRTLHVAPLGFAAYHAAAALAGNGIAALLDGAVTLMARAGVDAPHALDALGPLCRTSLENVLALGPVAALTGPVARGDARTIQTHAGALRDVPDDVARLYRATAARLVTMAGRRGLSEDAAARILGLLDVAEGERT